MNAPVFAAIGLLSACSLALELVLIRLLSIMFGHAFASMVISLALLGIGAGGVAVRLFRDWLLKRAQASLFFLSVFFAISLFLSHLAAKQLNFNPLAVMWGPEPWAVLAGTYTVLAVPFLCFGAVISLAMSLESERIRWVYGADLLGAGLGAVLASLALYRFMPQACLPFIAAAGLLSSALFAADRPWRMKAMPSLLAVGLGLLFLLPSSAMAPQLSEYKDLARAKLRPGAKTLLQEASPHGVVTLLASPEIPFRFAPGLSPVCSTEPPEQSLVFLNGDLYGALPTGASAAYSQEFVSCLPSQVGYDLLEQPEVLVAEGVKGLGVAEALGRRTGSIDVVGINQRLLSLIRNPGAHTEAGPGESLMGMHTGSLRSFVSRTSRQYDLMQLWSPCSGGACLGSQGLEEGFTCTVQGMTQLYRTLRPGGLIVLSRSLDHPPAASLKLTATVKDALQRSGQSRPERCLALFTSPTSLTILISKGELEASHLQRISSFCRNRGFSPVHLPGGSHRQADSATSELTRGVAAILGSESESFLDDYPYFIEPATDDSPYFSRFFRWDSLPRIASLLSSGGTSLMQWSYPILIAVLVQAGLAGFILILLPVLIFQRKGRAWKRSGRAALAFVCLGLAFLIIEIAFIQRLLLLVGDPVTAISIALASFLVFAGAGSLSSSRFGLGRAVLAICLLCLVLSAGLLLYAPQLMELAQGVRVLLAVAMCGLPAFFMGMPLPLCLAAVSRQAPGWIPWAWGVNGCASVLAPIVATLLAIHLGFLAMLVCGCLCYLAAYLSFRWLDKPSDRAIASGSEQAQ
jgi:hypothetical protein